MSLDRSSLSFVLRVSKGYLLPLDPLDVQTFGSIHVKYIDKIFFPDFSAQRSCASKGAIRLAMGSKLTAARAKTRKLELTKSS